MIGAPLICAQAHKPNAPVLIKGQLQYAGDQNIVLLFAAASGIG
jgi:hypothetical protein